MTSHLAQLHLLRPIITAHYGLQDPVCNADIRAEVSNLVRKQAKGNLDDRQELLLCRIEVATGLSIADLLRK